MFRLFRSRWRIKKTTQHLGRGINCTEYYVQWSYPLIPFLWADSSAHSDEGTARQKMRERQFATENPKKTIYFYKADAIPPHLPDEQKDRFCLAKEGKPKLKTLKYLQTLLKGGKGV